MWSELEEDCTLFERVSDQIELRSVEVLHSSFEIANPTVNQFGAAAAGARRKIVTFHERNTNAPGGGVECNSGSRGATPDH